MDSNIIKTIPDYLCPICNQDIKLEFPNVYKIKAIDHFNNDVTLVISVCDNCGNVRIIE